MQTTSIQWTDFTANPIRYRDRETGESVWACVKVSDGCKNCYAEALAKRFGRGGPFTVGQMATVEPYLDEKELREMLRSKRIAGKRVFVGDMTDVFGEWVTDGMLDRLFAVFALRPDVTWQVLSKRPARMREYLGSGTRHTPVIDAMNDLADVNAAALRWPLPNVWLGTSVEDQAAADSRIPELLATPAAVRFLSCEPLLGPVDVNGDGPRESYHGHDPRCGCRLCPRLSGIDWVIVGGESGPGARPCDLAWIRALVSQCRAAGVAVFVKQMGSKPYSTDMSGPAAPLCITRKVTTSGDGLRAPVRVDFKLRHSHGGDPEEWPEDVRVREFPVEARND